MNIFFRNLNSFLLNIHFLLSDRFDYSIILFSHKCYTPVSAVSSVLNVLAPAIPLFIILLSTIIVSNLLKTALKVVVKKRIKNFVSNKILLYRHRYSNSKLISNYLTTIFDVSSQPFFYL